MTLTPAPDRREFLHTASSAFGGVWIAAQLPQIQATALYASEASGGGQELSVLTVEEGREITAIAEQILPGGETAGAEDAGVVYFVDRALETFAADALPFVRDGLAELQATVAESRPGKLFSELPSDQQIAVLESIEGEPFFGFMRYLTVAGMFALPSYGGNRDEVGWGLLHFDYEPAWQPPFGFYDADAHDAEG